MTAKFRLFAVVVQEVNTKTKLRAGLGLSTNYQAQNTNKRRAFKRMVESKKFQLWLRVQVAKIDKKLSTKNELRRDMNPSNILVETITGNSWKKNNKLSVSGEEVDTLITQLIPQDGVD